MSKVKVKKNDEEMEVFYETPFICPFCKGHFFEEGFPGDQCPCGAMVFGIYGDKVLKS